MELKNTLSQAVTRYDRKQSRKTHYNIYALPHYLARVADIVDDVENGADVQAAIIAGFTQGPLRNACLRALGYNISNAETGGSYLGMQV